jgi:hypothetical protein
MQVLCHRCLAVISSTIGISSLCAMAQLWSHSYAALLHARQVTTVRFASVLQLVEYLLLFEYRNLNGVCMQASEQTN